MRLRLADHVRVVNGGDGTVVLDLRSGRYLVANAVGGIIVQAFALGASVEKAAEAVAASCRVSLSRALDDTQAYTGDLWERGLLRRSLNDGERCGRSADARARHRDAAATGDASASEAPSLRARLFAGGVGAFLGLGGLLLVDLLSGVLGFRRLCGLLRRVPVLGRRHHANPTLAVAIAGAVRSASAFYFRKPWALQQAAVAMALMRTAGFPARIVIGVRRLPFSAQTWIEVEGRVVHGDVRLPRFFSTIETL